MTPSATFTNTIARPKKRTPLDWDSLYIISWQLDNSLEMSFVLETGKQALFTAIREIMNNDQGSHFTCPRFTEPFLSASSKISMNHIGRTFDIHNQS